MLPKACLIASGLIPEADYDFIQLLDDLGSGFKLSLNIIGIPQGSGLGTSSILSAACIKAIYEFVGYPYSDYL